MMDKDIADFTLKELENLGVKYAEVRLEHTVGTGFMLKNGIPQIGGFDQVAGLGARFLLKNGLGFFSTNELTKEKIREVIAKAVKTTKASLRMNEDVKLSEEPTHIKEYEVKQKIDAQNIGADEKLKLLFEADKEILKTKINVPGRYLSLSDSLTTEYLITTEGSKITATVPRINFFYYLTIEESGQTVQRFWQYGATKGWEGVKEWNIPELLSNEAKASFDNMKNGIKPPTKPVDLIACPQVVGIMVHESVGHPYEADRILGREAAQAGESFVTKDMIGKNIGNEIVNVCDDPTIPGSFGYYLFDNEGVMARKKYLMKNGIINEFLHNRETAATMGLRSNGSSRAVNFDRESIVRMSNTYLEPTNTKEEELIKETKFGIYMKNFMEWNIDDKRFNQKYVGGECFLVENGELTKPVRMPIIEITTPRLWSSVDMVASNIEHHAGTCGKGEPMQAIPVHFGGPSIRLKNIRLG
jgi:TldD protein